MATKVHFSEKPKRVWQRLNRVKSINLRVSSHELANIDYLIEILHKRRGLPKSRAGLLVYLVEKEVAFQDRIRIVSK